MNIYWLYARARVHNILVRDGGELGPAGIIGAALVLVAYLMYPEKFYDFFDYLLGSVNDSAKESFDEGVTGTTGPKDKKNK